MIFITNTQRFDSTVYRGDPIIKESILKQIIFNPQQPNLLTGKISNFEVNDAIDYFQFINSGKNYEGWEFV